MRIVKYLLIILIPLVIILGNFKYLIFNFDFYKNLYHEVGVYQSFAKSETVDEATKNLFGYYRGKNELDHNFFSSQAILHLADVKRLIVFTSNFFYLFGAVTLALAAALVKAKQFWLLAKATLIASMATIVFILLSAFGLFSNFLSAFNQFHQLLFANRLWLFSPDDNLVKLFPQDFFVLFANRLATNIIVISWLIATGSFLLKKKFDT